MINLNHAVLTPRILMNSMYNVLDYTFVNQLVQDMNSEVKKEKTFKAPHVV